MRTYSVVACWSKDLTQSRLWRIITEKNVKLQIYSICLNLLSMVDDAESLSLPLIVVFYLNLKGGSSGLFTVHLLKSL